MKLALLVAAVVLAGCTTFPAGFEELQADSHVVAKQMDEQWSATPAIQYIPSQTGVDLRKRFALPAEIAGRKTAYRTHEIVTLGQLLDALNSQGYRILTRGLSTEKLAERVTVPVFEGTLSQLLQMLSLAHGLDFEYDMDTVMLTSGARYMVSVPQHKELAERVKVGLEGIGATNVKSDHQLGVLTFQANLTQAGDARLLLDRFTANAAMVGLQVAVIDLNLTRNADKGFDWASLSAGWGSLVGTPLANGLLGSSSSTGASTGTSTDTTTVGDGSGSTSRVLGALGAITGSGAAFRYDASKFSLNAAVKLLSRYGNARTTQDALTHTLAGTPAKISSVTTIPYLNSMGAVASSGGAVVGSSSTAQVDIGLEVQIEPRYDADDNLVLTETGLRLSSLIGYQELQNNGTSGAWKQPIIQKLEFENISRLRPGEVVMIGGITYDQSTSNFTSLPGLEKMPVGSESVTLSKHAIFLAIRPTVTVFAPEGSAAAKKALDYLRLGPNLGASTSQSASPPGGHTLDNDEDHHP
jgi:MSHA biogenesis protein MshL